MTLQLQMAEKILQQLKVAFNPEYFAKSKRVPLSPQSLSQNFSMTHDHCPHLQRLELLRHEVLNLDSKTIAEIKSYNDPPDEVHKVMASTFMVLGEPHNKVKVTFVVRRII